MVVQGLRFSFRQPVVSGASPLSALAIGAVGQRSISEVFDRVCDQGSVCLKAARVCLRVTSRL